MRSLQFFLFFDLRYKPCGEKFFFKCQTAHGLTCRAPDFSALNAEQQIASGTLDLDAAEQLNRAGTGKKQHNRSIFVKLGTVSCFQIALFPSIAQLVHMGVR
jgi:hypothetical protein